MGSDESDQDQARGRGLAGAAGAAAAAGSAIAGAQGLLGLDVAEAAVAGDAVDSVVPLGDAPAPTDDLDLDGDVDAFLAEDATVVLSDPADAQLGDDPVGDAFAAADPAGALGDQDALGDTDLDALGEPGGTEPDAVEDALDL